MNREEFERHARLEDHHWWFCARRSILLDQISRFVPAGKGAKVVEVGCGTGGNLRALGEHYAASGIEIDPYAADLAAQRSGSRVTCADFRQAPDALGQADAVVLADVLEHVQDDRAFLEAMVGLMKPGGFLFITVPAGPRLYSAHDAALGHFRRYDRETLGRLWSGLPVTARVLTAFNFWLYPLIRLWRLVRRRAKQPSSDLSSVPRIANALLYWVFVSERVLIRWRSLPVGASLLAVLQRG